jgi:hypothetical protein
MPNIMVDNTELNLEVSKLRTVAELVEYIKSSIDPDSIILTLTKDDEPLSENDWIMPLQSFRQSKFKITTGSKGEFVRERLEMVDAVINEMYDSFSRISKLFKHGVEDEAHEPFAQSLNDLNAFVGWLHSVYSVDEEIFGQEISEFEIIIEELKNSCVDVQSFQMQQSWWNLGDVLDLKILSTLEQIREMNARAMNKLLS